MSSVVYGALVDGGLMYKGLKAGTGGPNNAVQQLAVLSNVPAAGSGVAWEIQLWINCSTSNSYSGAHYIGARAQQGTTLFTNNRYNFTTSATNLPTTTVTVDSVAVTITMSLAAAATPDGVVSYLIRFEYRILSTAAITDQPTLS